MQKLELAIWRLDEIGVDFAAEFEGEGEECWFEGF